MGLSRLENFLRSIKGTTIHVNNDSLDATDSIENNGSSITRPFKNLQRALAEAVRFGYRTGSNNDVFGRTTIILHPSQYDIDNRPGALVKNDGTMVLRGGQSTTISEWSLPTNFNIYDPNNDLYKLNSIHGGVILPRGVTIWAYDLRKTIIRPLYVPNPVNADIERSCIFRLTGASLPEGITYFDANPNGVCYKDYTSNKFVPNFSHHKLACYEYVDGVNDVTINDGFLNVSTSRTDLEMYYEKIAKVYGESSGRSIQDAVYGSSVIIDLEPVIDEIRIVGSRGKEVGITSIRSGNGVTPTTTITVTLQEAIDEISVDTPIQISGVGLAGYDGQYVVYAVNNSTEVQYKTGIIPTNPLPSVVGSTLNIVVDTVTSASPYIKKCSLRSVYGMCGYHADGSVVKGFKSSVIAEFTGVSVQKDDNAFVKYDPVSGTYKDSTSIANLHKDSRARYKPEYENFHIKLSNDAFAEVVSSFAIGFAEQYLAESGGDISINACKSDFGAKAFAANGFKKDSFPQDNLGYIAGFLPPKEIPVRPFNVEFYSIDVGLTTSVGNTSRLYIAGATSQDEIPAYVIDGYRFGAKRNEVMNLEISNGSTVGVYTANVYIPDTTTSYEKSYIVQRINNNIENSISNNIITLDSNHNLFTGEKIRIVSDDGSLPDGLVAHRVGFAITTALASNRIKIADTFNNALANNEITLNRRGGNLRVVSRVSDKVPGDYGHPIQFDTINLNWYINVNSSNSIYTQLNTLGVSTIGNYTTRSFIERKADNRNSEDKIFRLRYVIPFNTDVTARPPLDSYILQESNDVVLANSELTKYFSSSTATLTSPNELRNSHYIADVKWSSNVATIITELPHRLTVGSKVETVNVIDGIYTVSEVVDENKFKVPLTTNPGTFNKNTTTRNQNLPYFKRLETANTYQIYKTKEIQEYIFNKQDGIYELIVVNNSNSPTVAPFTELKFSQPIENLYPQLDRDNVVSDPEPTKCFALPDKIGEVVVNNEQLSLTRETCAKFIKDFNLGFSINTIVSNPTGLAHTFHTDISHSYSGITDLTITNSGSNYVPGTYYGADLISTSGIGTNAKVRIVVDGTGTVTDAKLMNGGCAYAVSNTANIIPAAGFGTTTGFTPAVVTVSAINNNIGDTLYVESNPVPYRITGISSHNRIQVSSGATVSTNVTGYTIPVGKALEINSITYSPTSGIATVVTVTNHGALINEKIKLGGFSNTYFNQEVIVDKVNSVTSLVVNLGKSSNTVSATGNEYIFPTFSSNNGKILYAYDGLTTTITTPLAFDSQTDVLVIPSATSLGIKLGDYLKVDDEIFRVKSDVISNNVSVFKAQLGTQKQTHAANAVVRRIKIIPIELRRNSFIRASAHTFESVGYGPGNYSNALPERQDRKLSNKEKNLAHAFRTNGGLINYNANDENGDLYTTNTKTYSSTGVEEVYDYPINNVVGQDKNYDTLATSDVFIDNILRISGGSDGQGVSEIFGPLVLTNKLTSYSEKGIEAVSFLIQGPEKVSRKIGIGTTANVVGGYGDIIFNSLPKKGDYIGWSYTVENRWEGFGKIGP